LQNNKPDKQRKICEKLLPVSLSRKVDNAAQKQSEHNSAYSENRLNCKQNGYADFVLSRNLVKPFYRRIFHLSRLFNLYFILSRT
jgi:hypothetical protein